MHILATETEEQVVYFGQLIHPSYSVLPPSHKKLTRLNVLLTSATEQEPTVLGSGPRRWHSVIIKAGEDGV